MNFDSIKNDKAQEILRSLGLKTSNKLSKNIDILKMSIDELGEDEFKSRLSEEHINLLFNHIDPVQPPVTIDPVQPPVTIDHLSHLPPEVRERIQQSMSRSNMSDDVITYRTQSGQTQFFASYAIPPVWAVKIGSPEHRIALSANPALIVGAS